MRIQRRLLTLAISVAVLTLAVAYWYFETRGFLIVLENRSSRTISNIVFVLEDQGLKIERPRLAPGESTRVRFSQRDPRGNDFFLEFNRQGLPGVDKERVVGAGLFASKGRAVYLRLVDAKRKNGSIGVQLEGYWSETFDAMRWFVGARAGRWPGTTTWPSLLLDQD